MLQKRHMCEGCGLKQPMYGLASEGKVRWCAGCGAAEGAVDIRALRKRQSAAAGVTQDATKRPALGPKQGAKTAAKRPKVQFMGLAQNLPQVDPAD